jgi:CMP-N-acetylneuraminic acid synthetase
LIKYRSFYFPNGNVYAYPMDSTSGIDIDSQEDFELASYHLCKQLQFKQQFQTG